MGLSLLKTKLDLRASGSWKRDGQDGCGRRSANLLTLGPFLNYGYGSMHTIRRFQPQFLESYNLEPPLRLIVMGYDRSASTNRTDLH